jgi:hypothetical protein
VRQTSVTTILFGFTKAESTTVEVGSCTTTVAPAATDPVGEIVLPRSMSMCGKKMSSGADALPEAVPRAFCASTSTVLVTRIGLASTSTIVADASMPNEAVATAPESMLPVKDSSKPVTNCPAGAAGRVGVAPSATAAGAAAPPLKIHAIVAAVAPEG